MKKGICLTAIFPEAIYKKEILLEKIRKVKKESDFNCIEFYFEGSEIDYIEIGNYLKKEKISCIFLAGYLLKKEGYDLSSENSKKREEAISLCRELYEKAKLLRAKKMLILSGKKWKVENENELIEVMSDSLLKIHSLWKKGSPEITLEFFNDKGEPYLALGSLEVTKRIFERVEREGIGITFDTSHVAQLGWNLDEAFFLLQKWIHHIHISNSVSKFPENSLYGDKHPLLGIEEGDFTISDMQLFLQNLKKDYALREIDICSFEMISQKDKEMEWYWRKTIKQADKVI